MTRPWNGYHVLASLILFFGVVFAVNGLFIFKAVTTFRGEDEPKSYLQGIAYNDTLERHALQARLGWKATIVALRSGSADARVVVWLADHAGAPIENMSLTALLKHPSDAEKDREISLHPVSGGVYEGTANGVAAGAWDLVVAAHDAPKTPFEADRRVWLR